MSRYKTDYDGLVDDTKQSAKQIAKLDDERQIVVVDEQTTNSEEFKAFDGRIVCEVSP